jgi:hypothetical protein
MIDQQYIDHLYELTVVTLSAARFCDVCTVCCAWGMYDVRQIAGRAPASGHLEFDDTSCQLYRFQWDGIAGASQTNCNSCIYPFLLLYVSHGTPEFLHFEMDNPLPPRRLLGCNYITNFVSLVGWSSIG